MAALAAVLLLAVPLFSADAQARGSRIVFKGRAVQAMNPSGGGLRTLGRVRGATELAASEDGSTIVAVTSRFGGGGAGQPYVASHLYVFDGHLRHKRRLIRRPMRGVGSIAVSPDGRFVAFTRSGEIHVVRSSGRGLRSVAPREGGGTALEPSFSPDGRRIVYVRNAGERLNPGGDEEIYVAALTGSSETRLTDNDLDDAAPAFSPNGRQIAFASGVGRSASVRTMGVGGGGERIITRTRTGRARPDFSPSGRSLVFVDRAGGRWGIFTVRANGAKRRLARRVGRAPAPQWTRNP